MCDVSLNSELQVGDEYVFRKKNAQENVYVGKLRLRVVL